MMKISCNLKHAGGVFLCMAFIMALCSQAQAEEKTVRERGNAVIEAKGPDQISLARHEFKHLSQYMLGLPYNPLIYDENGRAIELKDLKVPCDAIIEYKRVRGEDPEVLRIEVKGYEDIDTTTTFALPKKKKKLPK
jgi:hypothetical protein